MRLFQSHRILHVDGMKILVMGLLTEDIMSKAKFRHAPGNLCGSV